MNEDENRNRNVNGNEDKNDDSAPKLDRAYIYLTWELHTRLLLIPVQPLLKCGGQLKLGTTGLDRL